MNDKAEVQVRLIDGHSGKPFVKTEVLLIGTNRQSGLSSTDMLFNLREKTGVDGIDHFFLSKPLPYRVLVEDVLGGCGTGAPPPIIMEQVLTSGYLMPNQCARKN